METMYMTYFEETEELLQKAEECLIQLENRYTSDNINELFRIAHSIKGASQMIGYDQIGNLTHRIEDLLDSVRKGRIQLDQEVIRLCFEGLDHVKTMVEAKKMKWDEESDPELIRISDRLGEEIRQILGNPADAQQTHMTSSQRGMVRTLKESKLTTKNRAYISIFFSENAPMIQVLLFMIINNIKEIGSLEYSNITDDDIFAQANDRQLSSCVMILNTDLEPAELYPYFEMSYVEKVEIIDISDGKLREQSIPRDSRTLAYFELFFGEYKKLHPVLFQKKPMKREAFAKMVEEQAMKIVAEGKLVPYNAMLPEIEQFYERFLHLLGETSNYGQGVTPIFRREYMKLLGKVYGYVRGRLIFKIVKARDLHFRKQLNKIVDHMDKSLVRHIFVDVSSLPLLAEDELADLIRLKRQLGASGITISIIAGMPLNNRLVNIFDAVQPVESFGVYATELDAVLSHT